MPSLMCLWKIILKAGLVTSGGVNYRFGLWIWLINVKAVDVIWLQQGM